MLTSYKTVSITIGNKSYYKYDIFVFWIALRAERKQMNHNSRNYWYFKKIKLNCYKAGMIKEIITTPCFQTLANLGQ